MLNSDQCFQALSATLGLPEGETPFPWQQALLKRFLAGELPSALDIPTGLGKTAVIAVWLVARAAGARVPRRLVYVVDRRAVVDQASAVAVQLRQVVEKNASLKQGLGLPPERHLPISTLRGQFVDNKEWLEDPSIPAIVLGTVDMVGSRLLFSGYGVSRKMRPYHAGLLGADTLIVLDEAHLVPPFERLVEQVAKGVDANGRSLRPEGALDSLVPRLRVLSLSATGRDRRKEDVTRLTEADHTHKVARKRLSAKKRLVLRPEVVAKDLPENLASEAWKLSAEGTKPVRVVVFCTSRDDAQGVLERLETLASKADRQIDADLFVGGRRVYEREEAAAWLEARGFIAGSEKRPERPTFVVATAAGEVGVDFDANHAVCDVVAWERMIQRFGRVNRRGDGEAQVTVVPAARDGKTQAAVEKLERWRRWLDAAQGAAAESSPSEDDDEAGEDDSEDKSANAPKLKAVERRIAEATLRHDATRELIGHLRPVAEGHDVSPDGLLDLRERALKDRGLSALLECATTPAPLHPPLMRPLIEAWSMTSLEEHTGRPEVGPWIRGWPDEEEVPQTTVVWRTHLPITDDGRLLGKRDLEAFRDAADPHLAERLETETWRVVGWLSKRSEWLLKKARTLEVPTREEEVSDGFDRPLTATDPIAVIFDPPDGRDRIVRTVELSSKEKREELERALRGATLMLDRRVRGLKRGLLADDGDDEVLDITEIEDDVRTGRGRVVPFRISRIVEGGEADGSSGKWRTEASILVKESEEGVVKVLLVESLAGELAESEEGRSGAACAQKLDEHQEWAEVEAQRIASALELPRDIAEVLTVAARLHDEGKRAERWQHAFNAPGDGIYAKTTSKPNLKLLEGYRHELGSLPHAERHGRVMALAPELRDLCLHVIATHHGYARPVIRTTGATEPPSRLVRRAQEIAQRFAALEKRWGPWGLAWFEALLRAADQQASRRNDLKGASRG